MGQITKQMHKLQKDLKITPILDKLLEYKRSWIQHVNRMPRNRLPRLPNWQKESWWTFEDSCGYVRPERVNKWPNSMTYMMMMIMMMLMRNCNVSV